MLLPVKPEEGQPMLGGAPGVVDTNQPVCGFKQFCIGCGGFISAPRDRYLRLLAGPKPAPNRPKPVQN